jgi:hypothetical protein
MSPSNLQTLKGIPMTTPTLDKQSYPFMMHLSILPKYDLAPEKVSYDATTQTSKISGMSGSWSSRSGSTGGYWGESPDDDSQEDD